MKKLFMLLFLSSAAILTALEAKEFTTYKLYLQNLDFSNSTQKEQGKRYGLGVIHQSDKHRFTFSYEKTATETFQPPLPKDLEVNKYAFKYHYQLKDQLGLQASYITIDDNLVKTDGGAIYGLGATYQNIHFAQFFSDYKAFDVYQSDLSATFKHTFGALKTKTTLIAKYLNLQDHQSNPLSFNAKKTYFTPGIKLHSTFKSYHGGVGAFWGKRVFAVMEDGLKVQHHGMEFEETYMAGVGKKFDRFNLMLKYSYLKATELPKYTENVIVRNFSLQLEAKF